MPADWSQPTLASSYADFLDKLNERDIDTLTMFVSLGTNIPEGAMRYVRASNKFQEYLSSVWTDKVISVAGGGTGATNGPDAITNLGLGTMAGQNANAVAITGGTISGLSAFSSNGDGSFGNDVGVTRDLFIGRHSGITGNLGVTGSVTSTAGFNGPASATNLTSGTVNVARLGSGAAGGGLKVLLDNNTWGDYGTVREIFRGNVSFGTSDASHDSTITWSNGTPASVDEIEVRLDGPFAAKQSGNGFDSIGQELISTTVVRFYKAQGGGPVGTQQPSAHYFTAIWHRIG